jgi:hypothetical protein
MRVRPLLLPSLAACSLILAAQPSAAQTGLSPRCPEPHNTTMIDWRTCTSDEIEVTNFAPPSEEEEPPHNGKPHKKKDLHHLKKKILYHFLHHNQMRMQDNGYSHGSYSSETKSGSGAQTASAAGGALSRTSETLGNLGDGLRGVLD